jgi:DNA-binding NarL/FixJ family response regulator
MERRGQFLVVGCVHSSSELLKQVAERQPEVAVISSILEGDPVGGLKVVRQLRDNGSNTHSIILLDSSDPPQVIDAFSAGAKGVVSQTSPIEALFKGIRSVHAGKIWATSQELQWVVKTLGEREPARVMSAQGLSLLTPREEQIVGMVLEGLPNQEIALKLQVSPHTVKNHLFNVYQKIGVSNRVELSLYTQSSGKRQA